MPLVNLPKCKQKKPKRDKPKDARDKFVKQLLLRESDERQRTQQELMQLMQQLNTLIQKEQKVLPAYHRRFKDEDPRSLFYYRMLRRIGLPEVHARFAPWFLKSNQIVLNRWSSVLFARLEQAFYARPEALSTLEVRMHEHQAHYDAIMKPGRRQLQDDGYTPSLSSLASSMKALEPREQNQLLLERAFRGCSFHHQHQHKNSDSDSTTRKSQQQQQRKTITTIQEEDSLALEKLELIPHIPIVNAPPGLAPQVRGKLESHGKHPFFTYNGRWKDGEMHGPMGVYAFSDGGKYSGEWKASQQHGSGCTVYPNGVTYRGSFVDGKFHGFGVMEQSGFVYEGEFKNGVRCGMGKLRFTQSDTLYEGEFYDNMRHGKGSETNGLGYSYTGVWRQNRMCGPGQLLCPDKKEFFKEQWPMCLLGEAIRMVKRERDGKAEKEESWYRQLLRVRDDLRALDLQYAFWDAEEARVAGEEDARIESFKKARREKREAQVAAKKVFTEKAQKEEEEEDEDGSESGEKEEDDEEESGGDENEEEEGDGEDEEGGDDDAELRPAE